ncbi:DUF2490 domain-containing protein [Legionella sp. D16C41]|uniref:DUF2490 domain-containing protein n=1 Tax=Legionella sp. D16C41 TaxID=3402688 RepID=UPI003AF5D4CA
MSNFSNAQTDIAKIWNTLTINLKHQNYRFYLEPQLRLQDAPNKLDQFLNNMGVGYQITPSLALWAGTTSLIVGSLNIAPNRSEFRFWQQMTLMKNNKNYNLHWRTRLEERKRELFPDLNYRLRNRLTVNKVFYKSLGWVLANELLVNLNKPIWITTKTLDQNRFFIGISQKASKNLTVGIGYLNQYIFTTEPIIGHVASLSAQWENN